MLRIEGRQPVRRFAVGGELALFVQPEKPGIRRSGEERGMRRGSSETTVTRARRFGGDLRGESGGQQLLIGGRNRLA